MLQMGTVLAGRYRIEKVIGQGGMGAVYLADDTRLPRQWAIKEMSPGDGDQATRDAARDSFLAESRILSSLDHPNLPHIADFFEEDTRHYLVMDYIQGQTLEGRLSADGAPLMPIPECIDLGLQLCKVLGYLHSLPTPIIFRDLKPANIILTPLGSSTQAGYQAKLIDFGIARFFRREASHDTRALGTPGYAAPEQYGKGQSDPRTDIFALAATLHHCLSGKDPSDHPFQFEALRTLRPEVSEGLERLIGRALALKPSERVQSADDFAHALEAIRRDPSYVPKSSKTAELEPARLTVPLLAPAAPPAPVGPRFDPGVVRVGQLSHGQDARTEVTLQGDVKGRLITDSPWLRVSPRKVRGVNPVVTVRVVSKRLPDAGHAAAHLRFEGPGQVAPLRVEVDVVPRRRSRLAIPAAVALCSLSLVPALGWVASPIVLLIALGTPSNQRSSLWWLFWASLAATLLWSGAIGLGVELWHRTSS